MKYKNYEVVNCYALNIRQGASIESKIIDTVKNGDILQVVTPNAVVEITDIIPVNRIAQIIFISVRNNLPDKTVILVVDNLLPQRFE